MRNSKKTNDETVPTDVSQCWRVVDETGYSYCDSCRKITPPIYEVVYQLRSAPQYHYFCRPCVIKQVGEEIFNAGLREVRERVEIRRENIRRGRSVKMPLGEA